MDISILTGLIIILVVSFLIYLLLAYLMLPQRHAPIGKDEYKLSQLTQVITSEELRVPWTSNSGSTLMFFIKPSIRDKTSQTGNEYAEVVQIGSGQIFKILVAPDAGRGLNMAPAVLDVYTVGYDEPESINIPRFPLQRWTAVAIVKSGRRFHIYLNGKLSATHTCESMPAFDATQPLRIGDKRLGGEIALLSISPYAMKTYEIREIVKSQADTSGKPLLPITIEKLLMPNVSGDLPHGSAGNWWCPGGNCSIPKKAGPLEQWSSPYA
jgi:hypothetical protein